MNSSSSCTRYWYDGLPEAAFHGASLLVTVALFSLEQPRYHGVPDGPTVAAPAYEATSIVQSSTHTNGSGDYVELKGALPGTGL